MSQVSGYQGKDHERRKGYRSDSPGRHFHHFASRKEAEEAARTAGNGNTPVHHTGAEQGELPHFHPTNNDGSIKKDGSHYTYGQVNNSKNLQTQGTPSWQKKCSQ